MDSLSLLSLGWRGGVAQLVERQTPDPTPARSTLKKLLRFSESKMLWRLAVSVNTPIKETCILNHINVELWTNLTKNTQKHTYGLKKEMEMS